MNHKKRPNILVFMTDQQHADTIGPAGLCRTPHLDALMEEGVAFSRAFTACPMCTPSRATVMTGLYPHEHRLVMNAHSALTLQERLSEGTQTIGSTLRERGYRTVYAGKWHVGNSLPTEYGFDEELKKRAAHNHPESGRIRDKVVLKDRIGEKVLAGSSDASPGETDEFRLAEAVNGWLEAHQEDEEPFFLFASCGKPHVPWIVPEPYASLYDPQQILEWPSYRDDWRGKPETYRKNYLNINFCRLPNQWPVMAKALAKYFGLVTMVDDAFGSIVKKLEETGLIDHTMIIFTSDHGEMMGRHGLVGKTAIMLDDLIRVPLVVYWKGRLIPGVRDELVSLQDLFHTLMEVAGGQADGKLDSVSFLPSLYGKDGTGRDAVYVEHHGTTAMQCVRAVRTARYKYVFRAHETDELYDLEQDPDEMTNRIHDPGYAEPKERLRVMLLQWSEASGDFARQAIVSCFANEEGVVFE
ncbi:sulfatase-like hydrolase/transferase [Paenibacillus sp. CC-CFT747]|nr:sulfatase-like hydrolase/transferase [Paenibacillus sp. CC-CFT747]